MPVALRSGTVPADKAALAMAGVPSGESGSIVGTAAGVYAAGTTYSSGQYVTDQMSSWVYINATPGAGHAPPTLPTASNSYWQLLTAQGEQGPTGLIGNWRGPWVTGTAYAVNDAASQGGSSYICLTAHTAGTFATDLAAGKWQLVVAKGDAGAAGTNGTNGLGVPAGGSTGQVLAKVSATDNDTAWVNQSAPAANVTNAIINGGFEVAQRGTSFSSPATGAYTLDRWPIFFDGTGATRTISQQSHTLGQTAVPGEPKNFLRLAQTVAGSGGTYNEYLYHIEGVRKFAGKTVTLTLYATLSTGPANITYGLAQVFGTGGSPSTAVNVSTQTASVGTAFTKWQATFAVPSISGKTLGTNNDDYLQLSISLPLNSTFTFDLSRVSLRVGDVTAEADPFIPRSFQDEWLLCQRYCQLNAPAMGYVAAIADSCSVALAYKVPMFKVPTLVLINGSNAVVDVGASLRTVTSFGSPDYNGTDGIVTKLLLSAASTTNKVHEVMGSFIRLEAEIA